jgi:DNA topoisomerase I
MPKSLFIVESPAKARTLSRYLGKDFIVKATVGHIKDLPSNSLGVNIEKDFTPVYRVIRGKSKVVQAIKAAAVDVESVYLASDPDREGEAIAWHVAEEISRGRKKEELPVFYRVLLHEITRSGLQKALDNAGLLDRSRYESQLARRILDRLVGYELSPLLWKKVSAGLSAGRVQSVAVALVVDRERDIQAFDSQEYWVVRATLAGALPPEFQAKLVRIDKDKAVVTSEEVAKPLLADLKKATYVVDKVNRDEKRRFPLPPFITSTLQQDAHRLYRFTAKKTMSIAQRLYEGVDLGDRGVHGLITYMRTDSTRLADEAVMGVRAIIEKNFGKEYLPPKPVQYKNKRSAQDAHEAIRPTSMDYPPEQVVDQMDRDMLRLYRLIWNRFQACQMSPARFDVTVATIVADGKWSFEATGRILLFDGYLKLYLEADNTETSATTLPELAVKETLKLVNVDGEQHFTQPPPRFTEGTLVKELEKKGIGRPSTYATILSTIQEKLYVDRDKGKFGPTELGYVVTDLLRENFPKVIESSFTAQMEEELDRIEEGTTKREEILTSFWGPFKQLLDKAAVEMRSIKRDPEKTEIECPTCKAPMVVRFGRNGAFLACSAFPECKTTLAFTRDDKGQPAVIEETVGEEACTACNGKMVLKEGRYGKFWACANYPECKTTLPFSTGHACPKEGCEGTLVEKRSKKKTTYYRCSNAPTCEAVLFGRIKETPCTSCQFAYLEERGRGKKRSYRCPRCGHGDSSE